MVKGTDVEQLKGTDIESQKAQLERSFLQGEFNKVKLPEDFVPDTFEAALAGLEAAGITVASSSELIHDDFPLIEKAELVNRRFIMLNWQISRPENESFGTPYFIVRGVLENGDRFRFVDGSTGIAQQLYKLTLSRIDSQHPTPNAGLLCEKGLSVSTYKTEQVNPKTGETVMIDAKTYYIADS